MSFERYAMPMGSPRSSLSAERVSRMGTIRPDLSCRNSSTFRTCSPLRHCCRKAAALRQQCRMGEHVRNVELFRQDKSGRIVPILLTLSALSDERGEPIGIAYLSKDIQKQKEAEK